MEKFIEAVRRLVDTMPARPMLTTYYGRDELKKVRELLVAVESAPVPPGYQLVPVTPTPEMLKEIELTAGFSEKALTVRYSALLAAAPKPTPIEVTDELLKDLYDHDHEDEWCGHDVCGQSLRRIVQRAFKYVGLEVK